MEKINTPKPNEIIAHSNGLPFLEAINSNPQVWENLLIQKKYHGNAEHSGQLIYFFCMGIKYGYTQLLKRKKIENAVLPRIDFSVLPQDIIIAYLKRYHSIVVSTNFLRVFENLDLEEIIDAIDELGFLSFKGKVKEYWYMTGVEEFIHSIDPDIKKDDFIGRSLNIKSTVMFHSQRHEYKGLGWQLKAALDNNFSESSISSTRKLLQKVIKYRALSRKK